MDKLKDDWNRLQLRFLKTCKPNRFSKFIFVWKVWNPAKETVHTVSDKKLWFCPSLVISKGPLRISMRSWYYQEIELYSRATVLLKPHQCNQISVFSNSISLRVYVDPRGGGYSWEFLVGVYHPVPQILTLFLTKKWHFPHPFSDLASIKLCHQWLTLERQHKGFLQSISNSHINLFFFLFLLGIETTNTFVHSVVPAKTITDSRPKWVNSSLYPFSDTNGTKTMPFGAAHTYMTYIREYPPPPPRDVDAFFGFCKVFHPQAKTPWTLSKFAQFVNCTVCLPLHVALWHFFMISYRLRIFA